MPRGWWWVVALWCTHTNAQSVHKCIAPGGAVSYQSAPCERPSREAANWEAPLDPPPSAQRRHVPSSRDVREPGSAHRASRTGSAYIVPKAPKPSACEVAKATRDRTLERVGLKRTFDLLSRLDEQVRNACR